MKLILKYLSIVSAIYLLSLILDTIHIGSIPALLTMGFILLIVNLLIKPLLLLLTLPFNLITFGLFTFIVNAWTIMIADGLVSGVRIGGFLNSLLTAFLIVIIQHLLRETKKSS